MCLKGYKQSEREESSTQQSANREKQMIHTRTWDERKLLWSLVILKKQNTLIAI